MAAPARVLRLEYFIGLQIVSATDYEDLAVMFTDKE